MDAEKTRLARGASHLLPDPGGEVVRDLLAVIDRIRDERDALAEQVRDLRREVAIKNVLAEHMAEIKAIVDGDNTNTVTAVVEHCLTEISKAGSTQPGKEE